MKQEIRKKIAEMSKYVDSWIDEVEKEVQDRKDELSAKAKELALIQAREKKVEEMESGMAKERDLIEKEKKANRVRTEQLDIKEREIENKIQRIISDFGPLKPL